MKPQPNQDLEAVVNALLDQLRQYPTKPTQATLWAERHFALPTSPEEVLWRGCWLLVAPAISALLAIPVAQWCWTQGYPWITVVGLCVAGLFYYLVYLFAFHSATSRSLQRLVDIQLALPPLTVSGLFFLEVLRHG
jgi:hypothetical protein